MLMIDLTNPKNRAKIYIVKKQIILYPAKGGKINMSMRSQVYEWSNLQTSANQLRRLSTDEPVANHSQTVNTTFSLVELETTLPSPQKQPPHNSL